MAHNEFDALVDQLCRSPDTPWGNILEDQEPPLVVGDRVFDSYVKGAVAMARDGRVDAAHLQQALESLSSRCGSSLDCKDFLTDLVRIVARESGAMDVQAAAEVRHLSILTEECRIHNDRHEYRKTRNCAKRAFTVLDEAVRPIPAQVRVELLVQRGRGKVMAASELRESTIPEEVRRAFGVESDLARSIPGLEYAAGVEDFAAAARLANEASLDGHFLQLRPYIGRLISELRASAAVPGRAPGEAIRLVEVALEAAAAAGEAAAERDIAGQLAQLYSSTRQPEKAEDLIRKYLDGGQ